MHEMPAVFPIHFLVLNPIQCDTQFAKMDQVMLQGP